MIQGPSGSGKSTLLKTLLGFLPVDSGMIAFNGNPMEGPIFKELRSHAAWLPQDLNLGAEIVGKVVQKPFNFNMNELQRPDQKSIVTTFQRLGLEEGDLQKSFATLSTGQRQRVGIAICALLRKPFLLLDEPTSALDKVSKQRAAEMLLSGNRTVISTSHDPFWTEKANQIIDIT